MHGSDSSFFTLLPSLPASINVQIKGHPKPTMSTVTTTVTSAEASGLTTTETATIATPAPAAKKVAIPWPVATDVVKGSCVCGKITWKAKKEGVMAVLFCYCKDCQEAHGANCIEAALCGYAAVEWTGEEHIEAFNRHQHEGRAEGGTCNNRRFCGTCKCHIASDLPGFEAYAFFTPSIDEGSFGPPHFHILTKEKPAHHVIGEDGLPIWLGFPPSFGGTDACVREADPVLAPHLA